MSTRQIYFPIGGLYPIPYEFEENTMPVPRGQFSILSELEEGNITSAEAIVYLTLNHGSTWESGMSWCFSSPYLSKLLGAGMSRRYVRKTLASLNDKGWIEKIETSNPAGNRYRIEHYLCNPYQVPIDYDGKPLTFSVPRGDGGPLERCFEGDIPWKAALVWIVLKLRSEWRAGRDDTGQTWASTLLELSKQCRMKLAGFQEMIQILEQQGMLHRITPKSKPAIFQIYPKPYPRPVSRSADTPTPSSQAPDTPTPSKKLESCGAGYYNEKYYYSRNMLYRCSRETEEIEQREPSGTWKPVSDYHRSQVMNPAIVEYFLTSLEAKRVVEAAVFGKNL